MSGAEVRTPAPIPSFWGATSRVRVRTLVVLRWLAIFGQTVAVLGPDAAIDDGQQFQIRNVAMDALVALVNDIKTAKAAGATDERLAPARDAQRRAQFLLDFIEAENSMGFHAPQEAMRVLALSIENSRQGQVALK